MMFFRTLLAALTLAMSVSAWDPFGLKHAGEDAVNELMDRLEHEFVPEVAQAIRDEVDHIFDDKLPDLITNVSKAIAELEDHAEQDAEILMKYTIGNITQLMNETISMVHNLVNQTVSEVQQAMDNFVDVHLTGLVDDIFGDINDILTRVENDIQQLACASQGAIDNLENFISSLVGNLDCGCILSIKEEWAEPCECTCSAILPTRLTCKCNPSSWASVEDILAFQYAECVQRKAIDSGSLPVGHIITLLGGLRGFAEALRCYHALPDGPTAETTKWYTEKVLALAQEIYVWRHPAVAGRSRRNLADCTDKTPYECWQLATQAAEQAKQTYEQAIKAIQDKADRAWVNESMASLRGQLNKDHAALNSSVQLVRAQLVHDSSFLNASLAALKGEVGNVTSSVAQLNSSVQHLHGTLENRSDAIGDDVTVALSPGTFQVVGNVLVGTYSSNGARATVDLEDTVGTVLQSLNIGGGNENCGPDGGSGMSVRIQFSFGVPQNCTQLHFYATSGGNGFSGTIDQFLKLGA